MTSRRTFLQVAAIAALAAGGVSSTTMARRDGSVAWGFRAPVLDQGDIGSCTGNAVTQFGNTDYAMARAGRRAYLTEVDAVRVYGLATEIDRFPGSFPGVDTGSVGSAACEAATHLGYLSGYACVGNSLQSVLSALRKQPLIASTPWMAGMFYPSPDGLITVSGYQVGGHEYVLLGFDMPRRRLNCLNSWSESWGVDGRFSIGFDDFGKLLSTPLGSVLAPRP